MIPMPDTPTLLIFLSAALILLITPGPAVLYIVARSIDQGRMAGFVSALGVGLGTLCHVSAAALGLSALLVSSALAFNLVKYLGAVYLIYLGLRKLFFEKESPAQISSLPPKRLSKIFYQGIVVNVLNPKTALFFFAFLPQFVDSAQGSVAWQIFFLGSLFVSLGIFSDGLWAIVAGSLGQWLKGNLRFLKAQRYFSGGIFILLGLGAAFAGSDNKH